MKIKNVIIRPVTPNNGLVGFASMTLGDDMALNSIAIYRKLDGRITIVKYDELVEKIMQEMRNIDGELVRLESDFEDSGMTVSNLLKLAANVDELFKSSKPAVKNQILRLVVSNLKIQQKRLNFQLLEPFATLVDLDSRSVWCPV